MIFNNGLQILKMKTMITFLIACLGLSCTADKAKRQQLDTSNLAVKTVVSKKMDDAFDIILQMDKINEEHYSLSATIELDSGSYVISPYSTDKFYLPFGMVINDISALIVQGDLHLSNFLVTTADQIKRNDCGISAVKTICNILDVDITRDLIEDSIHLDEEGASMESLK
jgi:hypothetical protein